MRLRDRDIDGLVIHLEDAEKKGDHLMSYDPNATYLLKMDIATFGDMFDAKEYSYENTTDIDDCDIIGIAPVLEKLLVVQELMKAFEGQEPSRSIPFSIAGIEFEQVHNYKLKSTIMNEQNVEYLERQLQKTGMGDISKADLQSKVSEGQETFTLLLEKKYGNDTAMAMPIFRKSDKGNYFFNSYDMTVKSDDGKSITQSFKVRNPQSYVAEKGETPKEDKKEWINSTITFKEAFNLLQGRSINKEFLKVDKVDERNSVKFDSWQYLDFKNTDANGNHPSVFTKPFDLEKELQKYPVKELLNDTYKNELISSLKRGNRQSVNYINKDDTTEKMYLEANPRYGSLKVYNAQMKPESLSFKAKTSIAEGKEQGESETEGIQKDSKRTAKQAAGKEDADSTKPEIKNKKSKKGLAA